MLVKIQGFMSEAMLHFGALVVLWVLLVAASYGVSHWCVKSELGWRKIIKWITVGMGIVCGGMIVLHFLPVSLGIPLTKVVIPYVVCAAALHGFLLAVDRYIRHKYADGMIQTRLVVAVITVYVVAISLALLVLKIPYASVMTLSDICIGYLTRIAIFGLLVLEILGGRCKESALPERSESDATEEPIDSYSSRW